MLLLNARGCRREKNAARSQCRRVLLAQILNRARWPLQLRLLLLRHFLRILEILLLLIRGGHYRGRGVHLDGLVVAFLHFWLLHGLWSGVQSLRLHGRERCGSAAGRRCPSRTLEQAITSLAVQRGCQRGLALLVLVARFFQSCPLMLLLLLMHRML